jgi:SulP family sulfate permease
VLVLFTTFLLTVLVDLTVAIEIGMVLAAFLFLRNMIQSSEVSVLTREWQEGEEGDNTDNAEGLQLPPHVEVFEISGPLFFGAAYKFKDAMKFIETPPKILIIRMDKVPIIDATGIKTIAEVHKDAKQRGTKLILSEVTSSKVLEALKEARLQFAIGKANITTTFQQAVERAKVVLQDSTY